MSTCPNKPQDRWEREDWVCLHLVDKDGKLLSAVAALRSVMNGWLYPEEIEAARKLGADSKTTEDQAAKELLRLEQNVRDRLRYWKSTL